MVRRVAVPSAEKTVLAVAMNGGSSCAKLALRAPDSIGSCNLVPAAWSKADTATSGIPLP